MTTPTGTAAPTPPRPRRRSDASMSLITSLMTDTLDGGYAQAAARRGGRRSVTASVRASPALTVGLVVVGLLLSTAAVQVRSRAGAAVQAREQLIVEIQERTAALDRLQRDLEDLRTGLAGERLDALSLTAAGAAVAERLTTLETVAGAAPVRGPGLRVTLDDAAPAEGEQGGAGAVDPAGVDDGRVLDYDLQRLVNGLWAAGAEAVAVNGRRLTSLTAIRTAGDAIVVDYRPLTRPYVVEAVGDPAELEPAFTAGSGGLYLRGLVENYGMRLEVSAQDELRLPGASGVTLRHARPPDAPGPEAAGGDAP